MATALELEIDFTTQQLELLDKLAMRWETSREGTLKRILEEAVNGPAPVKEAK